MALSLFATGLWPTRPGVDPGQLFPANSLAVVNSPVEVTVNGGGVGPRCLRLPRIDSWLSGELPVPPDIAKGTAAIQVSAAWIPGAPVNIIVQ